ncbi:EF-P 5-aminopentanol modification-associated protein YfmF [Streptococcus cameli]
MKLQEGVYLHFIPSHQFTTNRITVRFTAPLSEKTVAGRVLVANLFEIANQDYPEVQDFRRKLASLYGASLTTSVSKMGKAHIVDVTMTYVKERLVAESHQLTEQILEFLTGVLFRPLLDKKEFQRELFVTEKANLIHYLESEVEDNFYHADKELNHLFFQEEEMRIPRVATVELINKETAQSAYSIYKNMLKMDRIDVFVHGECDQQLFLETFHSFEFTYRKPDLQFDYQQDFSVVTNEKMERRQANQSIMELAFGLQDVYTSVNYSSLLVFNTLFGESSQSRLFMNIREKEGLAYTIGSSLHIHSGMLRIYAGIDKKDRLQLMRMIQQELKTIKQGRISEEELELAKESLLHSLTISQDRQRTKIEEVYHQSIYGNKAKDFSQLKDDVKAVRIEDVVNCSRTIRLQSLYFLEGISENE